MVCWNRGKRFCKQFYQHAGYACRRFCAGDMDIGRTYVRHKRCGDKPNYCRQQLYTQETTRKEAEYYAQNASGSKTAEKLNKYGTVVASAIPTLIMAMMTGGMSNAGMAKEGIEKAAFMAKTTDFSRYVDMARSVIKQTPKEPECANGGLYKGRDTHMRWLWRGGSIGD